MPSFVDDIVRRHRVQQAKREQAWLLELEQRRHVIASRACIDVAALRAKLGV
jgi:hypothetical protein